MKCRHIPAVVISGCLWLFIGVMLLTKGLGFIVQASTSHGLWLPSIANYLGDLQQAALALITLALFIGFLKGRFVLSKSAKRVVERLLTFPEPVPIAKIYSLKYVLIILFMVMLGVSSRWTNPPPDIRGFIDVAIGSALMNGALFYFKFAFQLQKQKSKKEESP